MADSHVLVVPIDVHFARIRMVLEKALYDPVPGAYAPRTHCVVFTVK